MKVAHINVTYDVGSTGRLIRDLVNWAKQQGDECRVFYSERGTEDPEAERYLSVLSRKIHAIASRISGLQGYWSKHATRRLITALKDYSPDVVHLHVLHGNCICLPMLFEYLHVSRLPVVITLHDCWWFTGRCVHPEAYQCDKFAADCSGCRAKNDCNPSWFFDRAKKMLTDKRRWLLGTSRLAVVSVSDWVAAQVKKSFIPEECIFRIYNWVDTDIFRPVDCMGLKNKLGLSGYKVVLGVAALWGDNKGLDDMIALSANLPQNYCLVLVGSVPGKYKLPPKILQIPPTNNREQLALLYSMADVFVNPSRMETFGLTTVEAMACGTPAIVYDTTACPELIGEDTGRILPVRADTTTLLAAVLALCTEGKNSDACKRWVEERFSRQQGCSQYYALYKKVTNA